MGALAPLLASRAFPPESAPADSLVRRFNTLSVVYDARTRTQEKRILAGRDTAGLLMQPDGRRVACPREDEVVVIDLQTLSVVGRIAGGHDPDGLAWASRL
jgi:hypothetical protein